VASDLAFLAMDLDHRGYPRTSRDIVTRYAQISDDSDLEQLIEFYKSYRAVVRAKVASITASEPEVSEARSTEQRAESRRYLHLAASYDLPPVLIMTCGLPGAGKTWAGRQLAGPLRAGMHRSDVVRKQIAGHPSTESDPSGAYGTGLYSQEMTERTYRRLLELAVHGLANDQSVIVDATFSKRALREPFLSAFEGPGRRVCLLHVTASEDTIRERLAHRAKRAGGASDADFHVYLRAREEFEPPTEVDPEWRIEWVSGRGSPEDLTATVIERLINSAKVG
jgi:predicted kinase